MAKRKKRKSLAGIVIVLGLIAVAVGIAMSNSTGDPEPIRTVEGYDDEWGKLDSPVQSAVVTEILLTWRGSVPGEFQEAEVNRRRSKEQARELAEEVWEKYRAAPNEENWKKLREISDRRPYPEVRWRYPPANSRQVMPDEFYAVARTTRVGFARIAESKHGIHVIRREE